MNLLIRLLWVVLAARFGRRIEPLGRSRITLVVLPTDLDLNLHLNNGRALSLLDLGRVDLMARARVLGRIRAKGWMPVVAGALVRWRKPLAPFRRVALETRIVGWDGRFIILEQTLRTPDGVACLALLKTALLGKAGLVPTEEVVAALGISATTPPLPEAVTQWLAAEAALGDGLEAPAG